MKLRNTKELKIDASLLRVQLDNTIAQYLESTGWSYTCNTPGSYWYWTKQLPDGRIILTNRDSAVQMQEYLDGK